MEPAGFDISSYKFFQAGFINGNLAFEEAFDFFRIYVHAGDIDSHFGKAGSRYETHVACPDDCYIH